MPHDYQGDIDAIARIDSVATILDVVCRVTGMGFAAIARVTEDRWITCAVKDEISFGLVPGSELEVKTTICDEIRESRQGVVIDNVEKHLTFRTHHTPLQYGFQSYISMPILREDGSFFGTLCAIDPEPAKLDNPETIGMFKLFAKLVAAQLDAEDKLALVNQSLAVQRSEAELREQFIAILGHDLRSPVAAIDSGFAMLLREPQTEKSNQLLPMMQDSLRRMSTLIENMLDFARGRLADGISLNRVSDFPIDATLNHVVDEIRAAHPDREVQTAFEPVNQLYIDHSRIAQLFSNLLTNALMHGSASEPVRVAAMVRENQFVLSVANAGVPIPKEQIGELFKPFNRYKFGGNRQGLGLGLYIVSQIAEAHGGKVRVTSSDIETRFTLIMPALEKSGTVASAATGTKSKPLSFWDFIVDQHYGPSTWGDFVRRLSRGDMKRPREVSSWREAKAQLDAQMVNADATEIRNSWRAFESVGKSGRKTLLKNG